MVADNKWRVPRLAAVLIPVGLIVGYFFLWNQGESSERTDTLADSPGIPEQSSPEEIDTDPVLTTSLELALAVAAVASERVVAEAIAVGVLRGRVVRVDGSPLGRVEVSWTSWDPEFLPFVMSSVEIPWQLVLSRTVTATTNVAGDYRFESAPSLSTEQPSFLWFTHTEHMAKSVAIPAGPEHPLEQEDVTLEEAAPMAVEVRNGGELALGAFIRQQGAYPPGSIAYYESGANAPKDRFLFLRSHAVGTSSPILVAPYEHRQKVWAELGELRSKPWFGTVAELVRLELFPSFTLVGRVNFPLAPPKRWSKEGWGTAQVRIFRLQGPLGVGVDVIPVSEDGHFGPVVLPLMQADNWRATLNGSLFIPARQVFAPPTPGEEVYVELDAQVGHSVWFAAQDEDENLILRSWVDARWRFEGKVFEQRFHSKEDGFIPVPGLPPGGLEGSISAEGYAQVSLAQIHVPQAEFSAITIKLPRVPSLRGKCIAGLNPLENFEIRFWEPGSPDRRGSHQVIGSKDGSFVLDNLPARYISLCAISPEFGRSEVVTVAVDPQAEKEITLFVAPPGTMTGQLVDGQTGEPISGGEIEVYVSQGMREMDPIGTPVPVGSNGRFQVSRLARGVNVVSFSAPGFSARELKVWYKDADVDLGLIELASQQELFVKLLLPDGIPVTDCYLTANGVGALQSTAFDEEGEILIENANAGGFVFRIRTQVSMGFTLIERSVWLRHGEPWEFIFDMREGRTLTVVPTGAGTPSQNGFAKVSYTALDGSKTSQPPHLRPDGSARVYGLGPGPALVRVFMQDEAKRMGSVLIEIDDNSPQNIVVEVPVNSRRTTLRVVDHGGTPMADVRVEVRSSLWPGQYIASGTTREGGLCVIKGLPDEADSVTLLSASGATSRALAFTVPTGPGEVVEIVFDTRASIILHITDEGVPQPQTTCRLWDLDHGSCIVPGRSPDANGNLVLDKLGADTYELRLDGFGYWPISMEVEATNGGQSYEVEARRVGNLELKFVGPDGLAFGGQNVSLTFLPTGEALQVWVSNGKLNPGPEGLRTDGQGRLTLTDIPHGAYRWMCGAGGGEVQVRAGETEEVVIQVL